MNDEKNKREIIVKRKGGDNEMMFEVTVKEGNAKTTHVVLLREEYYKKLTSNNITPEELIKKSFNFLLEREPKESILSEFDLSVISQYFSDYEEKVKN